MTLRAYQPAFTAGELSPALWARVDLTKYQSGLKSALNVFIHPHGGASNRAGLEFVSEVKYREWWSDDARLLDGEPAAVVVDVPAGKYHLDGVDGSAARLIPFQFNADQSYVIEAGYQYARFFKDGGVILSGGVPYEIVTPYPVSDLDDVVFAQEADVMYMTHVDHPVQKLARYGETNWTMGTPTFAPGISPPASITATVTASTSGKTGYVATTYRYKVAAVSDATGEESLPTGEATCVNDLSIDGGKNLVSWTAVAGASRYIVYKWSAGTFGYIGGTEGLSLEDVNLTPDTADGAQTARNPFSGAGNYPRAVTFIEQRLGFASTFNNPQAVYLSQSANYENFGYASPAKANDAVTFRLRGRQVNVIRSMLGLKGLLLLTSAMEWLVTGGSNSDAITPSAIKIDPQGYRGSSKVQPIVVGNTVLFAQRSGGVVRDFSYQFTDDAFVGKDLTILARHMFQGREIKSWAYAQSLYSIVWVVLDDGSLVSLTYIKEHEVWAWSRHESGAEAFFEDVVTISEDGEDVPYFIVRRTVGGERRRFIERMRSREFSDVADAFFVDCGLSYDGAAATVISGLDHLEGCDVVALADGNVVDGLTVNAGSVTLPHAASKVHVGLSYVSTLRTLDLDLGNIQGVGTVQGRPKTVSNVTLRVERTRGIFIGYDDFGRDDYRMVEYKQRSTEAWGEATRLYTGDLEITPQWNWDDHGNVVIKQFDPLPMTILAVMPEINVGTQ